MKLWQFQQTQMATDMCFNEVLERFQKNGLSGLVRENIQNSLDGQISQSDMPVKVTITTGNVPVNALPGIEEIEARALILREHSTYTKSTTEHMKKSISAYKRNPEVSYITFEDENTKGLSGASNGYVYEGTSSYSAYAYSRGVHNIAEDAAHEKSRGGSHGVGKIACNAASDLYVMYFANCDEFGQKHLGGTVQLIDHVFEGQAYRATGYFTDLVNNNFIPFKNNYQSIFSKNTRGLKIIIPFFRESYTEQKKSESADINCQLIRAVCDSFFMAIIEKKLVVDVNGELVNDKNIESYIQNPNYYPEQEVTSLSTRSNFTPFYFNTYMDQAPIEIQIEDKKKKRYNFELYFEYNPLIKHGRMAIIRTIGMKIEDFKLRNGATKPYNAVLKPVSGEEDEFLKSLENESHTKLETAHLKDTEERKNADTFLRRLDRKIMEKVEEAIRKANPTDGKLDTIDILYDANVTFKKIIMKRNQLVQLGEKNDRKLVKNRPTPDPTPNPNPNPNPKPNPKPYTYTKKVKDEEGKIKHFVVIHPNLVKRLVTGKTEHLYINLSQEKLPKNLVNCSLSMKLIDGQGLIKNDAFDFSDYYKSILCVHTNSKLNMEKQAIVDVPIKSGTIDLQMALKDNYNSTLKYVYYLEV